MARRSRPTVQAPPIPSELLVQIVRKDGTYDLCGVRVRCAHGNGDGSLLDEMERGVVTPVAPMRRATLAAAVRGDAARRFVASLPEAVPVYDD